MQFQNNSVFDNFYNFMMQTTVIILAAGRGARFASASVPKQYHWLAGHCLLQLAINAFARHPSIGHMVIVTHSDDHDLFQSRIALPTHIPTYCVEGGSTRSQSVRAGLTLVPEETDYVLIHDGVRPFVSAHIITRVLEALRFHQGATPALPITDALWQAENGLVQTPQDRSTLYRVQTPQGFHYRILRAAHAACPKDALDDVEIAIGQRGVRIASVEGDVNNIKITTQEDLKRAELVLQSLALTPAPSMAYNAEDTVEDTQAHRALHSR